MKLKKLGSRTLKTGLAVFVSLMVSDYFKLESPLFVSIAVIIAMQSSINETFNSSKNRILGTILGGVFAIIFSFFFPDNNIFIGIGVILIIYISNSLGITEALTLSTMVFLSIMLGYESGGRFIYAANRTFDTFIGLIIGGLINYFIFPHNIEKKVKASFDNMYLELRDILKSLIWKEEVDIDILKEDIYKMESQYNLLKEDIKYRNIETDLNFDFLFLLFEDAYDNIKILSTLNDNIYRINHENKLSLTNFFNRDIPLKEKENLASELDIVYNYLIKETLSSLKKIAFSLKIK